MRQLTIMYTCPQVQAFFAHSVFLAQSFKPPLINLNRSYQPFSSIYESHPALGVTQLSDNSYCQSLDVAFLAKAMEVRCRTSYSFQAGTLQGFVTRGQERCASGSGVVGHQ